MKNLLSVLTSPWIALLFRIYLSAIFIYASLSKISFPAEFAASIASYQVVPYVLVNFSAATLPWVELLAGALLLAGVRAKSATVIIGALMAVFTTAIFINLLRGTPISCGCFSSLGEKMTWGTFFRDLAWLLMAIHVYFFDRLLHLEDLFLPKLREA